MDIAHTPKKQQQIHHTFYSIFIIFCVLSYGTFHSISFKAPSTSEVGRTGISMPTMKLRKSMLIESEQHVRATEALSGRTETKLWVPRHPAQRSCQ